MAMRGESLSGPFIENPFTSFKTTEIQITSEAATPGNLGDHVSESQTELQNKTIERQYLGAHNAYEEYSVTIERRDVPFGRQGLQNMNEEEIRLRNTVAQANKVAKSYTLCCCLFFLSLLITWIPSTVFRIYTLYHTANSSFGMAYSTGLVLPLMGFWNAVIYTTISWDAVMDLFAGNLNRRKSRSWNGHLFRPSEWKRSDSKSKDSWVPRPRMLSLNSREGITEPGMPPTKVTKQNVGERSWTQ